MNIEKKANSIVESTSGTKKLGSDWLPSFYFYNAYTNLRNYLQVNFPGPDPLQLTKAAQIPEYINWLW